MYCFFCTFILSIALGQTSISLESIYQAFFHFNDANTEHVIIRTSRLTRAIIAAVVGASLAIAGALMRALTRNPLAAPDILGINAGAIFFYCQRDYFVFNRFLNELYVDCLFRGRYCRSNGFFS